MISSGLTANNTSNAHQRQRPSHEKARFFFSSLPFHKIRMGYKFRRYEEQYRQDAAKMPVYVPDIIKQMDRMDRLYQRAVSWAGRLEKEGGPTHPLLAQLLTDYVAVFSRIHENNKIWLTLYADTLWQIGGAHLWQDKVSHQRREKLRAAASYYRRQLGLEGGSEQAHPVVRSLCQFEKEKEQLSSDSVGSRMLDKKIMALIQQVLRSTLNNSRYELRHLFEWRSLLAVSGCDTHGDCADDDGYPGRIRDWVYGYAPLEKKQEERLLIQWQKTVGQELKARSFRLQRKIFVKWSGMLVTAVAFILALVYSDFHNQVGQAVLGRVQGIWAALFLPTREASDQQKYFREEILALEHKYTRAEVQARTVDFISRAAFRKADRYLTFSSEILRGYFLLLARGEADSALTELVLETAELIHPQLRTILQELVSLYAEPVIKESLLREVMLKFRRHFLARHAFPFMFLVADEDAPFIFLFTEPIRAYLLTEPSDLVGLKLSPRVQQALENIPQIVYFIPGFQYPFKTAAGYFEGEVAIVFTSISPNPKWTAWHELGHIIDNARLAFDEKLSRNVELNAMVFPLIFDEDRKAYLTEHLISTVKRAQVNDYYVQAAKGIINGVLIYQSEADPANRADLLTDRFEPDRIAAARAVFEKLSSAEIRDIAYELYQDPQRYLSTAKKGRYQAVKTNVDELMYGAHISPEQDVITTGMSGGVGKGRSRLLRDKNNDKDKSGNIRWGALFDALMVFLVFEALMVGIHLLNRPILIRKLYGLSPRGSWRRC